MRWPWRLRSCPVYNLLCSFLLTLLYLLGWPTVARLYSCQSQRKTLISSTYILATLFSPTGYFQGKGGNLGHRHFFMSRSLGFPGSSGGKESACSAGDLGSISPEERNGNALQCPCLENSMDRGACGLQSTESQTVGYNWQTNAWEAGLSLKAIEGKCMLVRKRRKKMKQCTIFGVSKIRNKRLLNLQLNTKSALLDPPFTLDDDCAKIPLCWLAPSRGLRALPNILMKERIFACMIPYQQTG